MKNASIPLTGLPQTVLQQPALQAHQPEEEQTYP